ncbi:MAG: tetratricopeptide repeat protein [Rhodocyclales bacterium]|nr:tetratricopeptide repeat protein [Rhodocyclales bacterium]
MLKWIRNALSGKERVDVATEPEATAVNAEQVEGELQRGARYLNAGDFKQAEECFSRVMRADTNNVDAHFLLGSALQAQGRLMEAIASYRTAATIRPALVEAHVAMGELLSSQGNLDAAIRAYRAALAVRSDYAELHSNLGAIYRKRGLSDQAEACYREAIKLKPDFYVAHFNLGNLLRNRGKLAEAEACYRDALGSNPDLIQAHHNLGDTLKDMGRFDEAFSCYDRSLALAPDYPVSIWHRTMLWLLTGDFQHGLPGYEYRWKLLNEEKPRHFTQPLWLGDADIRGKTILLYAEKGFGDTIQFVRYASRVAALGAKVILEIQPQLKSLLSAYPGMEKIVARGEQLPAFDYQCPLMSLPLAFKEEVGTIPVESRYIAAPPDRAAYWADRLGQQGSPRIGIVWSGNIGQSNDLNRSMELGTLAQLISGTNFHFFGLVKDVRKADQSLLGSLPNVTDLSLQLTDFAETAAIIENMDLVITVDTSVAHLACALGKPTWIMLSFVPDWRWLLIRPDSPWYPSAMLFRQPVFNDWDSVIKLLRAELNQFSARRSAPT